MKKYICIFLLIFLLCGCEQKRETVRKFALDTEISVTCNKKDIKKAKKTVGKCDYYEKIFSRTNQDSELYKLNKTQKASNEELLSVIDTSLDFSEMTNGAFDITIAPLCDLWNVKERTSPPSPSEISNALSNVGFEKIKRSPFDISGCRIDLGAIAKGYIADRLSESFKKQKINNVIIDLGGNVKLIGEYTVGIRSPFDDGKIFASIKAKDTSIVTSGSYQRYFEYKGRRYHHIIDPKTGFPSDSEFVSVTVISPESVNADALSTSIFIMGEAGFSLCSSFESTDCLGIKKDGTIKTTPNFEKKYRLKLC